MSLRRGVAVAVLAVAGLVAVTGVTDAGSGSAPLASTATTTLPGTPPQFDPLAFFTDLFTRVNDDPQHVLDLLQRVEPRSPAAAFVTYLSGFASARLGSRPGPLESFTVTASTTPVSGEDAVDVCTEGFCDQFSGFVVADGRLQSFLLNGIAIDDRVGSPSKAMSFGPISIRVVGAFERVTVDELAVVIAIASTNDALNAEWEDSTYVNPSGAEIPVDLPASAYPTTIGVGGDTEVVLQFPIGDLGGELRLSFSSVSPPAQVVASVPVAALEP
jgi:hypothetical protein